MSFFNSSDGKNGLGLNYSMADSTEFFKEDILGNVAPPGSANLITEDGIDITTEDGDAIITE